MFNLLPEEEKKIILHEYTARKAIVLLLFLFVSGIIAIIFLLPSNILSASKAAGIEKQIKNAQNSIIFKEADALNASLKNINLKLTVLSPYRSGISAEDLFAKIIEKKTLNIRIGSFVYKKALGKEQSLITISGIARDRESLSTFVQVLENEPIFTKVNLPVSNLTKNKNPDFSIEIRGTF